MDLGIAAGIVSGMPSGIGAATGPTLQDLFSGGEAGALYTPWDLSTMWQDSAGTTAAAVDSPVGRIDDQSGNGNNATQSTASKRPILRQSGALYYLEFDGVDDHLVFGFQIAESETWTFVFAHDNDGDTTQIVVSSSAAASPWVGIYQDGSAAASFVDNGTVSNQYVNGASISPASRDALYSEISGNKIYEVTFEAGSSWTGVNIGHGDYGGSGGFEVSGKTYGILAINRALTAAERTNVVDILAARSGVSA